VIAKDQEIIETWKHHFWTERIDIGESYSDH
jgi:hypothetical protein